MMTPELQELISSLITKVNNLERIIADLVGQEGTPGDEAAQDAVGAILTDTATIDFTYADATPSITADVKDGSITFAKMQDIATDNLLGRATASTGDIELIALTAYARTLIDDVNAAAARTTLELGTMALATETAYALLAGRGAGQTLNGGNAANESLILQGTSHATKTSSYVLLQTTGGNVGINTTSPAAKLQVSDVLVASDTIWPIIAHAHRNATASNQGLGIKFLFEAGTEKWAGVSGYEATGFANKVGLEFWVHNQLSSPFQAVRILPSGDMGIGTLTPTGQAHIDQSSTTRAIPVLVLDQADLSEEMIEFITTVGAGNPIDTAAVGTYYGKVRVNVSGVGYKYIALYNS